MVFPGAVVNLQQDIPFKVTEFGTQEFPPQFGQLVFAFCFLSKVVLTQRSLEPFVGPACQFGGA